MELTPEQVNTICKGDQEIAVYFHALLAQNKQLTELVEKQAKRIETLEKRVHELERQLGQNSNNSSKPPSSDGLRKPTNQRTAGGKKGAPKGHEGHTLRFTLQPDEIKVHEVSTCTNCSTSLTTVPSHDNEKRQVFDLPAPRVVVTEHRAEKKGCPTCGSLQQASFPKGVNAPVQYGDGFAAWTAYLHAYQLLPLKRIGQLFADLTGYRPSEATLLSHLKEMSMALEPCEAHIREQLLHSPVVHADETGLRVKEKMHWLHTISSPKWTLLGVHPSRGSLGMNALGVLPLFQGVLVHDCYGSYFKDTYTFEHALCNAHLLRECQGIQDYDKHRWATQMKELLQESWQVTKAARTEQIPVEEDVIQAVQQHYDTILEDGKMEWTSDVVPAKSSPKGRKSKSKAANLGERLMRYKDAILRFLWDARIPFDNNQAERDIRMVKVKAKISGSFRTMEGCKIFARLRSVISTFLKQDLPVLSSLTSALRGQFNF